MLASWEDVFAAGGYSAEELHEATTWLAAHSPPKFRSEHLGALTTRIRERKAVECRRDAGPGTEDRGTCALCGSTGVVVVPHPDGVRDGEWVPQKIARAAATYYTVAVYCRCGLGRWLEGRHEDKERTWRLDHYEEINPRWKIHLEARRSERNARATLGSADPVWEALMGRLLRQAGVTEDGEVWD